MHLASGFNVGTMVAPSYIRHALSKGRFRFSAIFFFALILLSSQTLALQHHHDVDLTQHVDCSICVKQGTEFDALPVTYSVPSGVNQASISFVEPSSETFTLVLTTRSRGPPPAKS